MSKWKPTTDLQTLIVKAITSHPDQSDQEIANKIISPTTGKKVSKIYVKKIRGKMGITPKGTDLVIKATAPEPSEAPSKPIPSGLIPPELLGETKTPSPGIMVTPQAEAEAAITADEVKPLLEFLFDRVTDITDWDGWKLSPSETDKLAPLTAKMLNKYLPTVMEKWFLELSFAIVVITIVGGRLVNYRKWRLQQEETEEPKTKKTKEKTSDSSEDKAISGSESESKTPPKVSDLEPEDKMMPPPMLKPFPPTEKPIEEQT